MAKYYLTLKNFHSVPTAYQDDITRFHELTGKNIGNLVFRKGLASIIKDLASYTRITFQDLASNPEIYKDAEIVVVSCANWLGTSPMHERANKSRANLLSKFSCPVVAFGLGIQGPEDIASISLGPNTVRLAKVLSQKSRFISCRCQSTARTLNSHGISNAAVTGCPSNFINLQLKRSDYRQISSQRAASRNVSCLISEVTHGNQDSVQFIKQAFSVLASTPSKYVLQVAPLLELIYSKSNMLPADYQKALPDMPQNRIINLVKDKTLAFSSVDDWLFAARRFDFSYGMRMHGSMVPLQAGVPTVIITHDKRTKELAEVMSLPRVDIKTFIGYKSESVTTIYDHFWSGLDTYLATRFTLANRFSEFLDENGLKASGEFIQYCNASP